MNRTELVDKSFTQKELDKYLDSMPAPPIDLETPRQTTTTVKVVKTTPRKAPAPKAAAPAVEVAPPPVRAKPTPVPRSGNH